MNWESVAKDCAAALVARRQQLGLTQAEVATRSGLNRRVVGEVERGKTTVRWDVMLRIASSLGLDLDLRLAGHDPATDRAGETWF